MVVCSTNALPSSVGPNRISGARTFSPSEARDWGNENYDPWKKGLVTQQTEEIKDYTFDFSVNDYLRGVGRKVSGKLQQAYDAQMAAIDSALDAAPALKSDVIVWRGSTADAFADLGVGSVFTDAGYGSTSLTEGVARKIAKEISYDFDSVVVKIVLPKGSRIGAYVGRLSEFPGQREFLLKRGTRFRVVERTESEIVIEVIP